MYCLKPLSVLLVKLLISCVVSLLVDKEKLHVTVLSVTSDSVMIELSDVILSLNTTCSLTYHRGNATESMIKQDYTPQLHNYTMELTDLQPLTAYDVFVSCVDSTKYTRYQSTSLQHFITSGIGEIVRNPGSLDDTGIKPVSDGAVLTEPPDVQSQEVRLTLNPVDVAIGVVFGAIGVSIVGALIYYAAKRIRHRQRMRRFLQYRQHDNDPFSGLEQLDNTSNEDVMI